MAKIGRPLSAERSKFNLQVTFSNRRNGIFNKASELCTLCAAEVAIITFSPGNQVYSFGHSSGNDVINRILTGAQPQTSSARQVIEAHHNAIVRNLIAQLTQSSELLDEEKKLSKDMNMLLKPTQGQFWWAGPIDEMSKPQL
ncbi:hypothetical protein L6164_016956 [Bauhinia variegata]|uniref:Uncharacterized protein n=1 Tax=Bauhinia variegata TaxID=167791 RepID=A0ACB9N7I7_BAUVA|nr:hypothetical protein L6164_016956 [Bauhinia variegata]